MIDIRNVYKSFGTLEVLKGVNLSVEKGEVVLSGSFTRPTPALAGDTFHADYGPLGAIAFRFV